MNCLPKPLDEYWKAEPRSVRAEWHRILSVAIIPPRANSRTEKLVKGSRMKIHEYQGKQLFAKAGVTVPKGIVARTPDEAAEAFKQLGGAIAVVKSQIHAGGRGKGRFKEYPDQKGVVLVRSAEEAADNARRMLGHTLVTIQTGAEGKRVNQVYVEAGLNIALAQNDDAQINIEFLPRKRMQAFVPTAACFVAPRVASWAEYRKSRRSDVLDWTTLTRRTKVAIFVPSDTSPQEIRDCLHEELAQALGPLNDLYRLPDSVFNDDNFHTVLTGFDMLILRLHYSPTLRNGMTAADVAARLPSLLAQLNPSGKFASNGATTIGPRDWVQSIETALGPKTKDGIRIKAADRALAIARKQGWTDNRLAFSHFAVARLNLGNDVARAVISFAEASRIYQSLPDGPVHTAHVDMQMAAFALSSGQPEVSISLADAAIPVVTRAENAALLATFMLLKAEALDQLGRGDEAQAVRLDSLGWARYGFGSDDNVRARMNDIAALSPLEIGG